MQNRLISSVKKDKDHLTSNVGSCEGIRMPRKKKSKLREMLDAIEESLSTATPPKRRSIREDIKNKKRKTRKSNRTRKSKKD